MHYATSTMQAPKYAQPGQPSRTLELLLELKMIADVTNGTTITPGAWNIHRMLEAVEAMPVNVGLLGKGHASAPLPLREQLEAERKRAEALAAKVSQTRQPAEGMDQLWNLCGKMERTLQQMERLMDGPYRMTCYPEPMEKRQGEMREVQTEPCAVVENTAKEVPAPAQEIPSVKSLLQRIRGKR